MKTVYIAFFVCLLYTSAVSDEGTGRPLQPRGLVHRSQLNAVLRPQAEEKISGALADPQIVIDQNITFHEVGCVVGRACSRIIQPNLPKSPKPTFKPYTKDDRNHFKGTLSMLYPPRQNESNGGDTDNRTRKPPLVAVTSTPTPATTQNSVWIVRPQKKPLQPSKDEKKTAVIDNIISLLKEISSNPTPSPLKEANYGKYQLKVTKSQAVVTTSQPKTTEAAKEVKSGVAVYRKPVNNLSYNTKSNAKQPSNDIKRPVLFSNNQPVYDKASVTTLKPFTISTKIDSGSSWFDSLIQSSKKNMLGTQLKQESSASPSSVVKQKPLSSVEPQFSTWTALPVSSFYDIPVNKKDKIENEVNPYIINHKNPAKANPYEPSKSRPYIITAEELRRKKEEEEERLKLERLKKQTQMLKPFIVSASFGFDPKRRRSVDLNEAVSKKLTVLPARGRSILRNIDGQIIETSADSTNLTELIMNTQLPSARNIRFPQDRARNMRYSDQRGGFTSGFVPQNFVNPENLTALIFSHEHPRFSGRNPEQLEKSSDKYVPSFRSSSEPDRNSNYRNFDSPLAFSHNAPNSKPSTSSFGESNRNNLKVLLSAL